MLRGVQLKAGDFVGGYVYGSVIGFEFRLTLAKRPQHTRGLNKCPMSLLFMKITAAFRPGSHTQQLSSSAGVVDVVPKVSHEIAKDSTLHSVYLSTDEFVPLHFVQPPIFGYPAVVDGDIETITRCRHQGFCGYAC